MSKTNKIVVIILALVAVIVVAAVVILAFADINEKNKLTDEINALSQENINMEIVSTGSYGTVEKMVKEDFKTYVEVTEKLKVNYERVGQIKALNIENYQSDGPEFTSSLELLNGIKTENQELMAQLEALINKEEIKKRVEENGIKGKYSDLYVEILEQIKLEEGVNKIKETDQKFDAYLDSIIQVLEYMKGNKNEWFIENNTLKSKSQAFIDEYNRLVQLTNIEL